MTVFQRIRIKRRSSRLRSQECGVKPGSVALDPLKDLGARLMNYVIVGGSRGLGKSICETLPETGDRVWILNRTKPDAIQRRDGVNREWIKIDLETPAFVDIVKDKLANVEIDALIYCAGIWDSDADPSNVSSSEIYRILNVNTSGFIASVVALVDNLKQSKSANVIGIGSISGLDNATGTSLGYSASKFGMRGAVHGLREWLREANIGVTCLSVGSMSETCQKDGKIPHSDVIEVITSLLRLSPYACAKDIVLPGSVDRRV